MNRPPTTARMKVDCLLNYVIKQFGEPLKCAISKEPMLPGDSRVQFDHTGALIHEGEHSWENLRPVLNTKEGHKRKTAQDIKDRAKGDRFERERTTGFKRASDEFKKPIPQPANPWPAKGTQKIRSRNSFQERRT